MCSRLRRKTRSHLEYLHLQVLSVVTITQLRRIFERRTNFDLGRLLGGAHTLKLSFPNLIYEKALKFLSIPYWREWKVTWQWGLLHFIA